MTKINVVLFYSKKTLKEDESFRKRMESLKLCNAYVCFSSFGRIVSDHWSLHPPSNCPLPIFSQKFFSNTDNTVSNNSSDILEGDRNELKKTKIQRVFLLACPVAEFSVSICSSSKFICSSDNCVPRLSIAENDTSYKNNIYKNRMM